MKLIGELWAELYAVLSTLVGAAPYILGYILLILLCGFIWSFIKRMLTPKSDYSSLKTVTFGDESAVVSNTVASVVSIVLIFVLWGTFTGSKFLPSFMHMPGAYTGEGSFDYTVEVNGQSDDATVAVVVFPTGEDVDAPAIAEGDGFAKNDALALPVYRTELLRVDRNDTLGREDGAQITAVNGQAIAPGGEVKVDFGVVAMTPKGTLNIKPSTGWQMEPIWLPSPEAVVARLVEIASVGFRNSTLAEHLGFSLFRVIVGFFLGALVGIPLGYAMGLSDWFRGWFDPIVEFMRPVPPLALIPLVIIWAGIGEVGKIILLFLAALWIMAIAARSGVSGVRISKVHAAYSLGASKWQIMRHVIIPNSLPEIFTGARVAMGV